MKKRLRELLEQLDMDEIAELALGKRRVLGLLTSLTFDLDPQIAWRAVEAMGFAASRIAERDRRSVRNHLRRLLWLITEESGGVCWRAPEAMAEIVRHHPKRFANYARIVVFLLHEMAEEDLVHFRAGVLWAIGRLGDAAAEHVEAVLPAISSALENADPQVRGMAAWCLGELGKAEILEGHPELLTDDGEVDFYEEGSLEKTTVGKLVRRARRS
jgi:HEAT repeat protein